MKEPARAETWLIPNAMPRLSAGKASVRMAVEFAISIAPPTPCTTRQPISQRAPSEPSNGSSASSTDAAANTAKPALYILTRPYMSPSRPSDTTSTAVTSM